MRYNDFMNNTKKLTQGAMLLAMVGALMSLDRYFFGLYLDEFVFLLQGLVLITYGVQYTWKDTLILSFGLLILTLLLGGQMAWIYCPLAIINGSFYVYGVQKNWDRKRLVATLIFLFVLGEVLISLLLLPLLGFNMQEMLNQLRVMMETMFVKSAVKQWLPSDLLEKLILVAYVFSILLTGVLEAVLLHLLSVYLLKRFKIREIPVIPLYRWKTPPFLSYVALLCVIPLFFPTIYQLPQTALLLLMSLALLGGTYLVFWGLAFIMLWGKWRFSRNLGIWAFLLLLIYPYLLVIYLLLGFLYGSGPLRYYLDKKRSSL